MGKNAKCQTLPVFSSYIPTPQWRSSKVPRTPWVRVSLKGQPKMRKVRKVRKQPKNPPAAAPWVRLKEQPKVRKQPTRSSVAPWKVPWKVLIPGEALHLAERAIFRADVVPELCEWTSRSDWHGAESFMREVPRLRAESKRGAEKTSAAALLRRTQVGYRLLADDKCGIEHQYIALVNGYNSSDCIAHHADDEAQLERGTPIVTYSFGRRVFFEIKQRRGGSESYSIQTEDGMRIVMRGWDFQNFFTHGIAKASPPPPASRQDDDEYRISVSFRRSAVSKKEGIYAFSGLRIPIPLRRVQDRVQDRLQEDQEDQDCLQEEVFDHGEEADPLWSLVLACFIDAQKNIFELELELE
jgi:alkylated DNA repair dioxygenase AlkB